MRIFVQSSWGLFDHTVTSLQSQAEEGDLLRRFGQAGWDVIVCTFIGQEEEEFERFAIEMKKGEIE